MIKKNCPPSIKETAFDCPHCGAFTTQSWFSAHASQLGNDQRTPYVPDQNYVEVLRSDKTIPPELRTIMESWSEKMLSGQVFLTHDKNGSYIYNSVGNLFFSKCYNCRKVAVWVHDKLIFPSERQGEPPNGDLPEDVLHDYEEARSILNLSPRGAAALLRLCIQKLCIFLGENGRNLDSDIASLVSKGLNPLVQKSLDIVRVIGNEAVHPGVIDLKDDRDTAATLFGLVNLIADQMITHPKVVNSMYDKLPETKKTAIAERDSNAAGKTTAKA